jgi:lipid A ethanolaminephosphotransferase
MQGDANSFVAHAARPAPPHALGSGPRSLRIDCPGDVAFALAVASVWILLYNQSFWQQTVSAMGQPSVGSGLFLASLLLLLVAMHATVLLLAPTRSAMRVLASLLFMVAAVGSYFVGAAGVSLDEGMLRNVAETDFAEVAGLLNGALVLHVLVFGVAPAILVWRVVLPATRWQAHLAQRATFLVAALAMCFTGVFVSYASYASYFREYKSIRYLLVPLIPVASAVALAQDAWEDAHGATLVDRSGNVERTAATGGKPLVLFIVVGETARAADFQLAGYERPTNPRLSMVEDLVYFDHATSCGTSTAISVPCMFSHLGRKNFDLGAARNQTNVLDSLVKAGFAVQWRDNNSGCKGVCARVPEIAYEPSPDNRALCPHPYCYDEIMLADLADTLRHVDRDTAIVFHLIGSHGPAYAERYPPDFEIFKPACRTNQLQRCTREEIANAYDNTIAYTDSVLARQIELLEGASDRLDGLLIYVSDHGESLGERGMYLHGMPYAVAPRVQTEIPMLVWTSRGYAQRTGLSMSCLRSSADRPISHDNVYDTLLGAAEVRDALYDPEGDILRACRSH